MTGKAPHVSYLMFSQEHILLFLTTLTYPYSSILLVSYVYPYLLSVLASRHKS